MSEERSEPEDESTHALSSYYINWRVNTHRNHGLAMNEPNATNLKLRQVDLFFLPTFLTVGIAIRANARDANGRSDQESCEAAAEKESRARHAGGNRRKAFANANDFSTNSMNECR